MAKYYTEVGTDPLKPMYTLGHKVWKKPFARETITML